MAADDGVAAGAKKRAAKAAEDVTSTARKAGRTAKKAAGKTTGTARAVRAARAGRVDEARDIVEEVGIDEGVAAKAVEAAEERHYQVEVNKRALSVNGLTKTLNDRWENGWSLAHILEQRGNTVLVFEKRQ